MNYLSWTQKYEKKTQKLFDSTYSLAGVASLAPAVDGPWSTSALELALALTLPLAAELEDPSLLCWHIEHIH